MNFADPPYQPSYLDASAADVSSGFDTCFDCAPDGAPLSTEKPCNKCGEVKDLEKGFYRKSKAHDGRDTICKACQVENNRRKREQEKAESGGRVADSGYEDPWRQLAAAVMHQAVKDLGNKRFKDRYGLIMFFKSAWFEVLCDIVELDPGVVRKELGVASATNVAVVGDASKESSLAAELGVKR